MYYSLILLTQDVRDGSLSLLPEVKTQVPYILMRTSSYQCKNKKCQSHVTNAPKELVKHKTDLRKVSCNLGDMLQTQ